MKDVFPYLKTKPPGNYVFKVSNRDRRTGCELSSKLCSGVLTGKFGPTSFLVLVFLLLTLSVGDCCWGSLQYFQRRI